MKHALRLVGLLVALALTLAGCSDGGGSGSSTGHNGADVEFATGMVPHHEQALRMVAMTGGRDISPELRTLARRIRATQSAEIDTMNGWLRDWGEPTDGGHMDGGMMGGPSGGPAPGMMGRSDFMRLGRASDRSFEDMWLRMMIRHHRGAIAMATTEVSDGEYPPAVALAKRIEVTQQAEIDQMRRMLGG